MIASATWEYIVLDGIGSTGFRVKRRMGGPPPIVQSGTVVVNMDNWVSTPAPATITHTDGRTYMLGFWSVTAKDAMTGQSSAQIQTGPVANDSHTGGVWSVTAKAYYIWNLAGWGGDNALLIDAFDVQAADFIADDFVDVTPDANGTLTTAANNGYIDTTTQIPVGTALTVKARATLPAKTFLYWFPIGSLLYSNDATTPATVGSPDPRDIVVHHHDVVVAFAFYAESTLTIKVPNEGLYNPWWWIETRGGLVPPGPPPPWMEMLLGALVLGASATAVAPEVRSGVFQATMKQIKLAAAALQSAMRTRA